ncbi:MAG: hypothetical protein ACXQTM_03505 [Methanosarcinales archaeon]
MTRRQIVISSTLLRHGINAIPRRWRRGLEGAEYIEGLALQLLEAKRKISKDICNIM